MGMKNPGDNKAEDHTNKQAIEEAVPMPTAACFFLRHSNSIACFSRLFRDLRLTYSNHIAGSGTTDLTGPDKK